MRKAKVILGFCMMIILLNFLSVKLMAQDIPPPNPGMQISIVSGHAIQFVFDNIDEYKNGILNGGQASFIRIGAINDWTLQFKADQSQFYGDTDPNNQMELNNVGVMVISTGSNSDDGTNIINYAKSIPLALNDIDATLLTNGTQTNKGYGIRNSFTLNWEMGTQRGNMNTISMLEQMIESDTYNLNIILTLMSTP